MDIERMSRIGLYGLQSKGGYESVICGACESAICGGHTSKQVLIQAKKAIAEFKRLFMWTLNACHEPANIDSHSVYYLLSGLGIMSQNEKKRWFVYSLRSLLVAVSLIAIGMGLWMRAQHLKELASDHHFKAMDSGYRAAAIQRPVDQQWEWKFPAQIRMDRQTISDAAQHWQASMYHAQLRDIYLDASRRPWLPTATLPSQPKDTVVPTGSDAAARWWEATFGDYVKNNPCLTDSAMGFPAGDENLALSQELFSEEQFAELHASFRERRGLQTVDE